MIQLAGICSQMVTLYIIHFMILRCLLPWPGLDSGWCLFNLAIALQTDGCESCYIDAFAHCRFSLNTSVCLPHEHSVRCLIMRPRTNEEQSLQCATTSSDCRFKLWTVADDTDIYSECSRSVLPTEEEIHEYFPSFQGSVHVGLVIVSASTEISPQDLQPTLLMAHC